MGRTLPAVLALEGPVRAYAWGSRTLLAGLRGAPPSEGPEAEVWFGAHPAGAAQVVLPQGRVPLDTSELPQPRFLLKLLAAGAPLSIQLHPDAAAATAGFAREEAAGVPRDAPTRSYRDPSDKPELLRALTPMRLLVGARPRGEARAVLAALLPGDDEVVGALEHAGLRGAAGLLLTAPADVTAARLATLRRALDGAPRADRVASSAAGLARELLDHHPSDAGVLVALLLRPVDLAPGDAVFVPAGLPHAYLAGLGVEVMRTSDNVVRGGLTTKHVDVEALVDLLDPEPRDARVEREERAGWWCHLAPTDAFVLHEADLDGELPLPGPELPRIVLCTAGAVEVADADGGVELAPGSAAYVRPDARLPLVRGRGQVFVAA